jgi:hypothetical protein
MRWRRFTALFVLTSGVLVSCGDGDEVTARAESPARPGSADGTERPEVTTPSTTAGAEPEPGAQDGPLCDAAQRIRDLDDRSNTIMGGVMAEVTQDPAAAVDELSAAIAELQPLIPELTVAYDDLATAAPEAIRDDISLVRDFTLSLMERLTRLDSPEDLAALEQQLDPNTAMAAGAATLEIDAVTSQRCGISIAG